MSESAQLIVGVLLFAGFVAVFLLGRSKPHKEHIATGTVMPNGPGSHDLVSSASCATS
jgi:hypothetical protein